MDVRRGFRAPSLASAAGRRRRPHARRHPTSSPPHRIHENAAALLVAGVVLTSTAWLGWQWLSLGLSEKEIAAGYSRIWDMRNELTAHGRLSWWTPWFMSGTSYALQYAQGFPLAIWLALSSVMSPPAAGKTLALGAMATSGATMFICARRVLLDPWAAALAAVAYALHPQQLARAGGAEHVGLSVVFPLLPLGWLTWTRATESGAVRDAFPCALTLALLLWTSSKHALIFGMFLGVAAVARALVRGRAAGRTALRGGFAVLVLGAGLGAFCIVAGLEEAPHARLFHGEDVANWQRQLSFKTLLSLADRDHLLSRPALDAAARARATAARERVLSLKMESGEKYAGCVLLGLAAATVLCARRRTDRVLFWSLATMFLACVALASGPTSIWSANAATLGALFELPGVPAWLRTVDALLVVGGAGGLAAAAYRARARPRLVLAGSLALAGLVFVPWFPLLAALPLFHDVRAPFAFYDLPATFALALMAAFFVTDVVAASSWRARTPAVVVTLVALMLVDYWPARGFLTLNATDPRAVQNIEAAYGSLRGDSEWTKTYYISTRYLHLLGPMQSGKPQVYEAWTKWMGPIGTGVLNEGSWLSAQANRTYLDIVGARYIVFDKGDRFTMASSLAREMIDAYRQWFTVQREDDDTVIFRNATAWPYVSAFGRAAVFVGDVGDSGPLTLALAARRLPLVHLDDDAPAPRWTYYVPVDAVYVAPSGAGRLGDLPDEVRRHASPIAPDGPFRLPAADGVTLPVQVLEMERPDSDQIHLRLALPAPGLVVINESYHPHWQARVDGGLVPLQRVSAGLMGLEIESGTYDVRLAFVAPHAYLLAAVVSVATLLLGSLYAFRPTARGHSPHKGPS